MAPGKYLVAALGLFAPTIRWHKGVFYIICTNTRRDQGDKFYTDNFYVTCTDIWADEWSDPIWIDIDGIDPSFFFDDDDRAYVQASYRDGAIADQICSIRQFEIELSSGKLLSDVKVLWGYGGEKSDIEAPHMYKKDGYYYLLVADGGTFEHHKARISRSKDIWGPFEIHENPLLTADGTNEYVQHVGHADLFQDKSGTWWAVALGVRDDGGRFPMGRETFLVPMEWPTGKWPICERARTQFQRDISPFPIGKLNSSKRGVRVDDVYIRNAQLGDYSFSANGTILGLIPRKTDMSATKGSTSFVGKRQRSQTCTISSTLHLPEDNTTMAGLAIYKDDYRHIEIEYDSFSRQVALKSCIKLKGCPTVMGAQEVTGSTLHMRITATAQSYEFSICDSQTLSWISLGVVDTLEMTANDFNGTIFGIWATTTQESTENTSVQFENFQIC